VGSTQKKHANTPYPEKGMERLPNMEGGNNWSSLSHGRGHYGADTEGASRSPRGGRVGHDCNVTAIRHHSRWREEGREELLATPEGGNKEESGE